MNKKEMPADRALDRLRALCARAEHSSSEMYEKLRRWGIVGSDADKIVDSLIRDRYVDDSRYVRAFVRDKVVFDRWGRRKIRMSLAAKHLDSSLVAEAFDEIDTEVYEENLRRILQSKIRSNPDLLTSYEGRTKLFRFAVSRGYEPDLASATLKSILQG